MNLGVKIGKNWSMGAKVCNIVHYDTQFFSDQII
jgi:hypothetical protein